jgi:hypothetical protein
MVALAATACSREGENPVLGDWEIDRDQTRNGAVIAVEVTDLGELNFRNDAIASKETVIPVTYVVEEGRVRAIRSDGRGEHVIEVLPDQRIRVELPIGVTAVYRRKGP